MRNARVIFVCGSLDRGRNGVGDYTRILAGQLIDLGLNVVILALYDKQTTVYLQEHQTIGEVSVRCYRIPRMLIQHKRLEFAIGLKESFQPDWVSIQYVPYSYHPKGFAHQVISVFEQLCKNCKVQIFFHELWVGAVKPTSLKNRAYALLQRMAIASTVSRLNPDVVSTHIEKYIPLIPGKRQANILPLIGNIPVSMCEQNEIINDNLVVVQFGSFTDDLEALSKQLLYIRRLAESEKRTLQLRIIGPHSKTSDPVRLATKTLGEECIELLGLLGEGDVSCELQRADLGLARETPDMIAKSGSALAMFEHGLPVLFSDDDSTLDVSLKRYEVLQMNLTSLKIIKSGKLEASAARALARSYKYLFFEKGSMSF